MRALKKLALLALLSIAACSSTSDPCKGQSGAGACIAARVEGSVSGLTSLEIVYAGQRMSTGPSSGAIHLPAEFAILLPSPAPIAATIEIDGLRGSDVVAADSQLVNISNGRGAATWKLTSANDGGVPDLAGDGGDNNGDGDIADDLAGDMAGQVAFSGLTPIKTAELTTISIDIKATDPLGTAVTLTNGALPGSATFTSTGPGAGHLSWKPSYTDAGSYSIQFTATPANAARQVVGTLKITVVNAADPIVVNGAAALGAVPIGDWDKDGFGDVAVCTGDSAGATGQYHIKIVYGAASGMPLTAATQMARTDSFDVAATQLGGSDYSCQGGDYDGDGHADIIFADPHSSYTGGGTPNQGVFMVLFGGARGTAPPTIHVGGPENFGQSLGLYFSVGDFNGDGKSDIGTVWDLNAGTYVLYPGGTRADFVATADAIDYTYESTGPCHAARSVAFVDFNHDGKAEWVVEDPGINEPTGGSSSICDGTDDQGGGLRVIKGKSGEPLLSDGTGAEGTWWEVYYPPTTVNASAHSNWANSGAGCDVDGDGYQDLGEVPFGTGAIHGNVLYGSSTGIVGTGKMPLPDSGNGFDLTSSTQPAIACAYSVLGKTAIVASSSDGTTGTLHFYSGKPLTLLVSGTSPDEGDINFGAKLWSSPGTDVNGDGKDDLIVISSMYAWVIYGS